MSGAEPSEPAGDPTCWLEEVCAECGGLDRHRAGCSFEAEPNDANAD